MLQIRPLQPTDYDFFLDMHYESIYIVQNKPPKHELLNAPNLKKYHEGWGRKGDKAVIAEIHGSPAGAAWYRLFNEDNQGYGFIDRQTPELGIAIHPNYRHRGIGMTLMKEIIQQAKEDGFASLSLSVDPENQAAVRLYEGLGFEYWGLSGTSWTMVLRID